MRKFLLLLPLLSFSAAFADVTLPPLISDNMLLQRSQAAVWGKADPGEAVTVKLGTVVARVTADKEGKWRVKLDGLQPGIAGDMTVAGKNTLTVKNVAVGDVWVCSGQSNMSMAVGESLNPAQEIAAAKFSQIRMFTAPPASSETPLEEVKGKWEVCSPTTVAHWSAIGYFFGRQLHQDLSLPIGLIHSAWGGSWAQSWMPLDVLQGTPEFHFSLDVWRDLQAKYAVAKGKYENETLPQWQSAADAAKAAGQPEPQKPTPPTEPPVTISSAFIYNAMIAGATKYPIKGVLWYQGEGNTGQAQSYRRLLPALISSWRKAWNQGEFPFYIVQLANYMERRDEPADSNWADLRDSQRLTAQTVTNSGLAVAIDVGNAGNIHPKNKQEVGRRLALVAEAKTYGKAIVYSGPDFDTVQFDGSRAVVSFKPGTALGLAANDGEKIKGFALAGEDKKFFWADAAIQNAPSAQPRIVLTAPQVAKPVAVRYAWANNPEVNMVNKAGLPAVPFRSDDWPQVEPPRIPPNPTPAPK